MTKEKIANDRCPDEWTLSRFVENRLDEAAAGAVLEHVAGCVPCRKKISDFAAWMACLPSGKADAQEQARARRVWLRQQWRRVAECFRPKAEFKAAADGQTNDECHTQNVLGSGFIHFLSRTPRGTKDGWHVRLRLPARLTEKTILHLSVLDGAEVPVARGTLHFCRLPLAVEDGEAKLPLIDFQRNMNEAAISLCREGGRDVPGDPVLGYDLMG